MVSPHRRCLLAFVGIVLLTSHPVLFAHEQHRDDQQTSAAQQPSLPIQVINTAYLATIKPLFQRACFDCHSSETRYPWYYHVPGIAHLIDRDIREGKKHLDMSRDFPFQGHGSPRADLEAIGKAIRHHTMPPRRYRLLHWDSVLTADEQQAILQWVNDGLQRLP